MSPNFLISLAIIEALLLLSGQSKWILLINLVVSVYTIIVLI